VGDGTGRVAVIVPDELRDAVQAAVHEAVAHSTLARSGVRFDEQIMVCGAQSVKGLEYDAVMVVEPGLIEQEAPTRLSAASDLYVALTRPTQRLLIVRTQADETLLDL
jgi:DNA helicase IV